MQKTYTYIILSVSFFLFSGSSNATVWNVSVLSTPFPGSFSPNALPNVVCGDTIRWTWVSGSHNTVSNTIPAGATPWSASINSSNTTFDYKVPNFAGVYNYSCTIHGFTGSFTVSCSVGIDEPQQNISSLVYPNPFGSQLTLENYDADMARITDISGQIAATAHISGDKPEINVNELAPGVYFLTTYKEGVIQRTQKIIKIK